MCSRCRKSLIATVVIFRRQVLMTFGSGGRLSSSHFIPSSSLIYCPSTGCVDALVNMLLALVALCLPPLKTNLTLSTPVNKNREVEIFIYFFILFWTDAGNILCSVVQLGAMATPWCDLVHLHRWSEGGGHRFPLVLLSSPHCTHPTHISWYHSTTFNLRARV